MSPPRALPPTDRLSDVATTDLRHLLAGDGLVIDLGAICIQVRSTLIEVAPLLQTVYPYFPMIPSENRLVDATVSLLPATGVRRWVRPLARVEVDGIDPFGRVPRDQLLPHFEWSVNWAFANAFNAYLLLHAGAVVHRGCAMLLAASPGSGKSTLTAALAGRGARLLSDEFGVVRTSDLGLVAVAKPIALKNESIGLIREWTPDARMGPIFVKTRKGDLAHHAVPRESVDQIHSPAVPRVVLFPRWTRGAEPSLIPVAPASAFMEIAKNSFNYELLGPEGFETVARLVESCACYRLEYCDLPQAMPIIDRLCDASVSRATA